jgi:hypothetical protein
MKKYFVAGILVLLFSLTLVIAMKPTQVLVDVIPSRGHAIAVIPEHAQEIAPDIFSLGSAVDVDGRVVEGIAFIDRVSDKRANAKPTCNNNNVCEPELGEKNSCGDCKNGGGEDPTPTSTCFAHLAKGAKWKSVEDYVVDPSNVDGLDEAFIRSNLAADIIEWEDAAGTEIFGDENLGKTVNRTTLGDLTGENEVMFADISESGVIGVTIVWGIFGGNPNRRELVEWNQIYDDADFDWTDDALVEPGKMDFENIAQHELGHGIGMGHPTDTCTEETMYAFATEGETKKRDLNPGDIAGVVGLYA